MSPVRNIRKLIACALVLAAASAVAQDEPESRPTTQPAPAAAESRPAEIRARHPRLGLRISTLALEQDKIARVEAVLENSPAAKAGVKIGDVIAKVDDKDIRSDKDYRDAMSRRKAGDTVMLIVRRGSDDLTMPIQLVDRLPWREPDHVVIQHVLVKCANTSVHDPSGRTRTIDEARKLAEEILVKAKNGADFGVLVKTYSEDPGSVRKDPPGSYMLVLDGKPKPRPDASEKSGMVPGFSAVAFSLEVGDIALCPYDPELSGHGFHIIRRIE